MVQSVVVVVVQSVVQWSERWTLGLTAQVRVLAGALRCGLKQAASLTLLRLLG